MRKETYYTTEKTRVRKPEFNGNDIRDGADATRTGADISGAQKVRDSAVNRDTTVNRNSAIRDSADERDFADSRGSGPAAARASRKRRTIGRFLIVFLIALTSVLLIGVTPLFSISDIEINGNSYYNDTLIISKSGLRIGQNGFSALIGKNIFKSISFRCATAEQAVVSACPYIKSIQARYILPRTIRIDVEERYASFVAPYFSSGLLVDGEGVVVDITRNYIETGLPVALGLSVERYLIGEPLSVDYGYGIETILSVLNAIKQADRDSDETLAWKVETIDISDYRNIILNMNNGIGVNLGDGTDLYYRVSAAKEIIAHGIEEGSRGTIIFSNGARPVFVPAT